MQKFVTYIIEIVENSQTFLTTRTSIRLGTAGSCIQAATGLLNAGGGEDNGMFIPQNIIITFTYSLALKHWGLKLILVWLDY